MNTAGIHFMIYLLMHIIIIELLYEHRGIHFMIYLLMNIIIIELLYEHSRYSLHDIPADAYHYYRAPI